MRSGLAERAALKRVSELGPTSKGERSLIRKAGWMGQKNDVDISSEWHRAPRSRRLDARLVSLGGLGANHILVAE